MYHPFNSFFIRTPFYSFNILEENSFEILIQNPQIQEAIYLATPVLFTELKKYIAGKIIDSREKKQIESAIYRYIIRMYSRCTPFGLFAGCSIGYILSEKTNILLKDNHRHSRLDMSFLCALSQILSQYPTVKNKIKYYPNTTFYEVGEKYRYVESQYKKNKIIHQINSVTRSVHLDYIIKIARKGITINDILSYLTDYTSEQNEALLFIEELIDSQIIVNEIAPSLTGNDYFKKIIRILEDLNISETLLAPLKEIEKKLYQLDFISAENISLYENIIENIKKLNVRYDERFLFQVDLIKNTTESTLSIDIINELQAGITILNKITFEQRNETLYQFQQAFYSRYENSEIPLLIAIDPEIGIGYPNHINVGSSSPLLENFHIPAPDNHEMSFQLNTFLSVLFQKALDAIKRNDIEVILYDDDVKKLKPNWNDLPPTIYSYFEILKSDTNNPLIYLNGVYGISGAKLFTRFAHTDKKIAKLVNDIALKEQELMPDVILAEIVYLPHSRAGNVLTRPHMRDYEILCSSNSDLPENRRIYISDLYLSIRKGKICLRSKKLNKEIVPRLTNAHNYRKYSTPAYQLLCDLQMQYGRTNLFFDWGNLDKVLTFVPRVRYKNIILSLATWKVKTKEMKYLFILEDDCQLLDEIKKWCKNYSMPQLMLLVDGDNELLVDWKNVRSIRGLFSIIKKTEMIILKEFLYDPEYSVVRDEKGNPYRNEFLVPFYKNQKK